MTMRIVIENTDKQRKARVTPRYLTANGPTTKGATAAFEIEPGQKADVWIHSGQDFICEEV